MLSWEGDARRPIRTNLSGPFIDLVARGCRQVQCALQAVPQSPSSYSHGLPALHSLDVARSLQSQSVSVVLCGKVMVLSVVSWQAARSVRPLSKHQSPLLYYHDRHEL